MNKDIVYIEWVDSAHAPQGWQFESDAIFRSFIGKSVGFIYKEDEYNIFLVPHIMEGEDDQLAGYMVIPKVSIIKLSTLNPPFVKNIKDELFRGLTFLLGELLVRYHSLKDKGEKEHKEQMLALRHVSEFIENEIENSKKYIRAHDPYFNKNKPCPPTEDKKENS